MPPRHRFTGWKLRETLFVVPLDYLLDSRVSVCQVYRVLFEHKNVVDAVQNDATLADCRLTQDETGRLKPRHKLMIFHSRTLPSERLPTQLFIHFLMSEPWARGG